MQHSQCILVYVMADHSVSLEPVALVQHLKPLKRGKISRKPWISEQRIKAPNDKFRDEKTSSNVEEDQQYMSTLVFKNIAKNMGWKRLTGQVTEYQVYEDPLL
ncbi:hypothetical protein TI39_contig309g00022 [Zymoseptoria brevis]|uniref:Uncharacterized protein n=1 Tax=Zymoseptoria brevis TaxID=1047168 RepID=A0A0F4GTW4_9PEZI|nr:hypothetical protein TI39_contig309g00022 [Zymoseptoria brevis]